MASNLEVSRLIDELRDSLVLVYATMNCSIMLWIGEVELEVVGCRLLDAGTQVVAWHFEKVA